MECRMAFNSSAEMNAMAGNLASRSENTERSRTAYERALVRSAIAGFDVYKNDLNTRLAAATGGATTVRGADERHTPATTNKAATGETEHKENTIGRAADRESGCSESKNLGGGDNIKKNKKQ